jgi:cholesterol transport system auxiliary component
VRTLLALISLLLAGCITVDIGGEGVAQTQYVLADAGPMPPRRATPVAESLLIQVDTGDPLADTLSMAYARRAGERAVYQLATWTDRPSRRIPQLLQRRLEARGSFGAVAALGQPLHADWMLALAIDDIHHDVVAEPGRVLLTVRATLFDRRKRALAAQHSFSADVAVPEAKSSAAAAAMNRAVAQVLDALVPWLEEAVDRAMRNASRAPSLPHLSHQGREEPLAASLSRPFSER